MSFNSNVSNYKVVSLLETFPKIGYKPEMVVIVKIFKTYVFSKNLSMSLRKVHCSLEKVPFSLGNMGPSLRKIHCPLKKLPFSQGNFSYSVRNLFGTSV
jgi:hypothetical protein